MLDSDLVDGAVRRTAHEYVRNALRHAILRGTLPAGSRIVQSNLAKQLEVSTTPVREALRDLATEGLVQLDAHRGAVVKRLSFDDIRELQDLYALLEPEAMRRVTGRVSEDAVVRATHLAEEMEAEQDAGRWAELNRRFHEALVSDLDGTRLYSILKGLRDSCAPYIVLSLQAPENQVREANDHHRQLLEAIQGSDIDRATELSRSHAALTMSVLERARHLFSS